MIEFKTKSTRDIHWLFQRKMLSRAFLIIFFISVDLLFSLLFLSLSINGSLGCLTCQLSAVSDNVRFGDWQLKKIWPLRSFFVGVIFPAFRVKPGSAGKEVQTLQLSYYAFTSRSDFILFQILHWHFLRPGFFSATVSLQGAQLFWWCLVSLWPTTYPIEKRPKDPLLILNNLPKRKRMERRIWQTFESFIEVGIWATDHCCLKRPLCQLLHNHGKRNT